MPYRANYPRTVTEVLDDRATYRPEALRAVRVYRRAKPWRGTPAEQEAKMRQLHAALCEVYGLRTRLEFKPEERGSSYYTPAGDVVVICGKVSVVTYLHELAHARGMDERRACRWSINLFRRCFPVSYGRCEHRGHMLIADRRQMPNA